ncbi:arsenate reductase [Desmospora sp. 8437]|nr:arsenate reductase [Desmospora sp. 8437]
MVEEWHSISGRKLGLFVCEVLKADPDDWQDIALQALADDQRVAVRAGHGVGKMATEAGRFCGSC